MKRSNIILLAVVGVLLLYVVIFFNGVKGSLVEVDQQWGQVEVAYQARADKSKNLVEIVKGAADFEKTTLTDVIEARSKATSIQLHAEDLTPEKIAEFEAAQAKFSSALSRLMVTVEQYPNLKATDAFRELQAQYEGMENRIAVARREFNEKVGDYNGRIVKFPGNLLAGVFGFTPKDWYTSQPGSENAPDISFK